TMEDASGEDLDWFWRGWFYGIQPVDISLDTVKYARADLNSELPQVQPVRKKADPPASNPYDDISKIRNREDKTIRFYTDEHPQARDFYWQYARGEVKVDTSQTFAFSMPMSITALTPEAKEKF